MKENSSQDCRVEFVVCAYIDNDNEIIINSYLYSDINLHLIIYITNIHII